MRTETFEPENSPSHPPARLDPPEDDLAASRRAACLNVPELKRLQYFFGQMLGPQDFRDEQSYFREKQKLHNRCLHGFGVVCGLEVVAAPAKPGCDPVPEPRPRVLVRRGLAYDCAGNELVVRRDLIVDLLAHLPPSQDDVAGSLWLSLCFCEQPVDPARPVLPDACGASPECSFGKLRDAVRVRVSRKAPGGHESCDGCCSPCADPCVPLARIDFVPGRPPEIHDEVRRPITPYLTTRVESVNWSHGARYSSAEASRRLASLQLRFSRKVRSATLQDGVVDVWVIEGGGGRRGNIYNREGRVVPPDTAETDTLVFEADTGETLQDGDRVLITVRTGFVLDVCGRPVDGENVGGRVPMISDNTDATSIPGASSPRLPGLAAWSAFESWFFVSNQVNGGNSR
ncbi:MAG TPA: hypothetical protein VGS22_13720 [Thermoanaerobaculia bacterium]|jgi:hypothetical protein|nr:hypothetical protein [Thermoanaerobaculia bacterium]